MSEEGKTRPVFEPLEHYNVPTDMVSGAPLKPDRREVQAKVIADYEDALREALLLKGELNSASGQGFLKSIRRRLEARLMELANRDRVYQALESVLADLNHRMNVIPQAVEARMRFYLGDDLPLAFTEEGAAPERDTGPENTP